MNAFVERFNRTIQEEYTNFKQWDLLQKIQEFNRNLMDWLILREHESLDYYTPLEYLEEYTENNPEFKKRWTGTII